MEPLLIIIIFFALLFFFLFKKKEEVEVADKKKYYKDIFDKYHIRDYKDNEYLIQSIKYSLHHEIFEYDLVQSEPSFPHFLNASIKDYVQDIYTHELEIDNIISSLKLEFPDDIDDFIINEVHELFMDYRNEINVFLTNKSFCTAYLLEVGLITQEAFIIDGSSITAYRTLLNDSIHYVHKGTNTALLNFKFVSNSKNETNYHNNAIDFFEQILIKHLRENNKYLSSKRQDIFKNLHTVNNPLKVEQESKYHELILRINHVLNNYILDSFPAERSTNFLSLTCDNITTSWSLTKKTVTQYINNYEILVNAYQNKDLKSLSEAICFFERANFLLSADTISIVNSLSNFKLEILNRLDELEYSITGRIDDVQNDMESKLDDVQSSANAAAAAATIAAVQSTRAVKRLKK